MKKSLLILLIPALVALAGCDRRNIHSVIKEMAEAPVDTTGFESRSLHTNDFSSVEIACFSDITFHQTAPSEMPHIILSAPAEVLENVRCKVLEGELSLSLNNRYKMPDKAVLVAHIYAPFVNKFVMSGGKCLRLGKLKVASPLEIQVYGLAAITAEQLEAHELRLSLNGAGSLNLQGIQTGQLIAATNGDGDIILSGNCESANLCVNGNGLLHLKGLKAQQPLHLTTNGKVKVER
ncbi:MAG: DUF2807 domain-containing protein [Bacteroidales bacterium]|nr:DUF2807 domain-containing protein [Bacteroidales bacterium]